MVQNVQAVFFDPENRTIVGVGIMVAHNPLHGSGRAVLLHPALALGNNAKTLPGIRMTHASQREPASYSALHLCPRYTGFLAAPPQYSPPDPSHSHAKVTDTYRIHRHRVVIHVLDNHLERTYWPISGTDAV